MRTWAQPCPTLFDPMDYSPPGSSVHGILQARILEWVAIPFSRGSSQLRDLCYPEPPGKLRKTSVSFASHAGRQVLTLTPLGKLVTESEINPDLTDLKDWKGQCSVAQSCMTLCDPMDCSLPGSSVHGICQIRRAEWVVIPFSKGSFRPRDLCHLSHEGSLKKAHDYLIQFSKM